MREADFSCVNDSWEGLNIKETKSLKDDWKWWMEEGYVLREKNPDRYKIIWITSFHGKSYPKGTQRVNRGLPLFHRVTSISVYAEVDERQQGVGILGNFITAWASWEFEHPVGDNLLNPIHVSKCLIRDL